MKSAAFLVVLLFISPAFAQEKVFIRAELDRPAAYPGQQIILSHQLYTQIPLSGIDLHQSPPMNGFWAEDLEIDKTPKGEVKNVDGREYQVYTVKKTALFATTEGALKIPSSTFALSINERSAGFAGAETVYRKSPEVFIAIAPLPSEGRPEHFTNAVGSFTLTSDVDASRVNIGEAVALRITLQGTGNLKMIPDISLPPIAGLSVYLSKHSDDIKQDIEFRISGYKKWEYALVPQKSGRIIVPPISFSFFDPEQKKYATTASSSIELTIGGDEAPSIPGFPGTNDQESHPAASPANNHFYRQPWFYGISAILILIVVGSIALIIRKGQAVQPSPKIATPKQAAYARLKIAEKAAGSNPRFFYDQAEAALSGFLCDKFGFSKIEITEDALEEAFSSRFNRFNDLIIVKEITACLQECDFARFVSASQSPEKCRALSNRIKKAIDLLDE